MQVNFLLIVGALSLAAGLAACIRPVRLLARGRTVTGLIIEVREDRQRNATTYWITTEFAANDGQRHRTQSVGSRASTIGGRVPVLYDPANPGKAEVRSIRALWSLPGYLLAGGVIFAGSALYIIRTGAM